MGLESYAFGHKDFKINDSLLFRKNDTSVKQIHIVSFGKSSPNQRMELVTVTICYDKKIDAEDANCPPMGGGGIPKETVCTNYNTWVETGGGGGDAGNGGVPTSPPGTSGGGSDNGGGWTEDPCAPQTPIVYKAAPCDGGSGNDKPWVPVDEEPPVLPDDGYQLTSDDIRIFNQLAAEDMAADDNYYNKDCKGTLRGGNHKWPGTLAHWIVMIDYICTNPASGEIEYAIPGSSANGNRGYADMVNLQSNEIFEIKKFDDIGNGKTEVQRYVDHANENCTVAAGSSTPSWRHGVNYSAKNLPTNTPGTFIRVWLAEPGVIAYRYDNSSNPIPTPLVVPISTLDKLKTLVNKIKQHVTDADKILAQYMRENPELVNYLKSAAYTSAIAIVVGTIAEDFLTAGGGILDDWASFTLAYRIVRFAWAL